MGFGVNMRLRVRGLGFTRGLGFMVVGSRGWRLGPVTFALACPGFLVTAFQDFDLLPLP